MLRKFLFSISLIIASVCAQAQYVEEQGSLEIIYENRARSVLNSILRPSDYSVVVSIELDRDDAKLKDFQETLELNYLPGMPMMGQVPALPSATNKLHEMKAKTEVSILLTKEVSPDVEKVIKDVVSSKLHLDQAAGDVISVKRIQFAPEAKDPIKPDLLPDLSWKMWALVVIIALLAIAGIALLVWRRGKAKEEEPEEEIKKIEPVVETPPVAVAPVPEPVEEPEEQYAAVSLDAIKQHVVSVAGKYPQMAARAVSDHCMKASPLEAAYFMENLGWDQAKQIFSEVPAVVWAKVGAAIKGQADSVTQSEVNKGIRNFYKTFLAGYVEHEMSMDDVNPFGFVLKMNDEDRLQLLNREKPANIAVLCVKATPEVTASILSSLDSEKKVKVLAEIAKLEKLSHEKFQASVSSFQQLVMDMKNRPEPNVQGAKVLANVIKGMQPEEEMQLLQLFANENPDELERVRRHMLIFDDLKLVPQDILTDNLSDYEVEALYAALFQSDKKTIQAVISSLPERKAMMVGKEIEDQPTIPSIKETARFRREMTEKVSSALESRGIRVIDLIEGNVKSIKSA